MPFVGPLLMLISSFSVLASLLEANLNLGQFAYSNLLPHVNAAGHSTSRSTPCPQSMNPGPLTSPPPRACDPLKNTPAYRQSWPSAVPQSLPALLAFTSSPSWAPPAEAPAMAPNASCTAARLHHHPADHPPPPRRFNGHSTLNT
jgi:hypothetical protein